MVTKLMGDLSIWLLTLVFMAPLSFTLSRVCEASESKLSASEFTTLYDAGKLTLHRAPILPAPDNIIIKAASMQKTKNKQFKDSFLYPNYLKTDNYLYSVFYEWWSGRCVFRAEMYKPKNPSSPTAERQIERPDPTGEAIDIKYCEQMFGFRKDQNS